MKGWLEAAATFLCTVCSVLAVYYCAGRFVELDKALKQQAYAHFKTEALQLIKEALQDQKSAVSQKANKDDLFQLQLNLVKLESQLVQQCTAQTEELKLLVATLETRMLHLIREIEIPRTQQQQQLQQRRRNIK